MTNCLLCQRRLKQRLTVSDLLFPGEVRSPLLCQRCRGRFVEHSRTGEICQGCGREEKNKLCQDCRYWQELYGWTLEHHPLFHYNQAMKDYMQTYKFQGHYQLRVAFNEQLKQAIELIPHDMLIPIPVTEHTMLTRGFNQVTGMLEGVMYEKLLVHRERQKVAQSKKDRQSRLQTKQPFGLINGERLREKDVLLVDDIYTTGRTLYHAANLCLQNGCKRVRSLSLAR